jgi:hypothetical protein
LQKAAKSRKKLRLLAEVPRKKPLPLPPGALACEAARGGGTYSEAPATIDRGLVFPGCLLDVPLAEGRIVDILQIQGRYQPGLQIANKSDIVEHTIEEIDLLNNANHPNAYICRRHDRPDPVADVELCSGHVSPSASCSTHVRQTQNSAGTVCPHT